MLPLVSASPGAWKIGMTTKTTPAERQASRSLRVRPATEQEDMKKAAWKKHQTSSEDLPDAMFIVKLSGVPVKGSWSFEIKPGMISHQYTAC